MSPERANLFCCKLAGYFAHPVWVDAVEEIGPGVYVLKVRHGTGQPDETQVTAEELEHALAELEYMAALTDSGDLFRGQRGSGSSYRLRTTRCSRCR